MYGGCGFVARSGSFANGWEATWLLKKVAGRHLPRELVYRPKHGFSVPLDAWLGVRWLKCCAAFCWQATIFAAAGSSKAKCGAWSKSTLAAESGVAIVPGHCLCWNSGPGNALPRPPDPPNSQGAAPAGHP